jgi:Radical SAM superfamily
MILNESIDVESQIRLLIQNGWYEDARNVAQVTHQHGLISKDSYTGFMRALAGKPATTNPGHEVYGCTIGFDANNVLSSLQFRRLTNAEDMKKAFKQAVNKIEIETSTQCNRRCTYCPNSNPALAHRREKNDFLDMDMLEKLLSELQEIDYDRKISLVGMNEFFMHEDNFEYAELVKAMLPRCRLQIYSNGDYLDRDFLDRAEKAGVDLLVISWHLQAGKAYNVEDVLDRAMKFKKKTDVQLLLMDYAKGLRLHFQAKTGRLHILAGLVNWNADGHNWSGAVDAGKQMPADDVPCESPVNILCLTQSGDFTLCCAVPRERTPENIASGAVMGNLKDFPSIFHAYAGDAMLYWRQHSFSTGHIPPLCQGCSGRNAEGNHLNKNLAAFIEQQRIGYVRSPAAPLKRAAGE